MLGLETVIVHRHETVVRHVHEYPEGKKEPERRSTPRQQGAELSNPNMGPRS